MVWSHREEEEDEAVTTVSSNCFGAAVVTGDLKGRRRPERTWSSARVRVWRKGAGRESRRRAARRGGGGLLIDSNEQAARHGDSGGAVATARAVRLGRYRGYREKKEILRKPPSSYFMVLFFLRQRLK